MRYRTCASTYERPTLSQEVLRRIAPRPAPLAQMDRQDFHFNVHPSGRRIATACGRHTPTMGTQTLEPRSARTQAIHAHAPRLQAWLGARAWIASPPRNEASHIEGSPLHRSTAGGFELAGTTIPCPLPLFHLWVRSMSWTATSKEYGALQPLPPIETPCPLQACVFCLADTRCVGRQAPPAGAMASRFAQ